MEKRVVIGTLMVLLAIAAVGFVIYIVFYYEPKTPENDTPYDKSLINNTPYGKSLAEPVTEEDLEATWEAIYNSDAAYLLDPDFDVTADNFYQSVHDLLGLPARLYFYSTDDQIEGSYKCDSSEIRTAFAGIFQEVSLTECSEEEYDALAGSEYNTDIGFWSVAGGLGIRCYHDYSCVTLGRFQLNTNSSIRDYFYVGENLHDRAVAAYEKLLPYSMEAPRWEVE